MWNQWDYRLVDELVHPSLEFRGSLGTVVKGREGLKSYMRSVQSAFPDFHNRIDQLVTEPGRAAVRLTYRGAHQGELWGIVATGRTIQYVGAAFFELDQGRFTHGWVLGDTASLRQQLLGEPDVQ
jgi:predicted ester cyclase